LEGEQMSQYRVMKHKKLNKWKIQKLQGQAQSQSDWHDLPEMYNCMPEARGAVSTLEDRDSSSLLKEEVKHLHFGHPS